LNYTSGLRFVFPINAHRHAIMNQSEVRLHSGRSVHFLPSRSPRPSFRFFRGSGSETRVDYILLSLLNSEKKGVVNVQIQIFNM